MNSFKLKASAILISFFVGAVLSVILITSFLAALKDSKYVISSSETSVAYFAAKSGINHGLVKYKAEKNNPERLFNGVSRGDIELNGHKSSFDVSVEVAPLTIGERLDSSSWYKNSNEAIKENALELNSNKQFDINLVPFFKTHPNERPREILVYISNAFRRQNGLLSETDSGEVNSLAYSLWTKSREISHGEIKSSDAHELKIDGLSECQAESTECVLTIKAEVASSSSAFLKIKASNAKTLMTRSDDLPGTIYIRSIGYYSRAKKELIYKMDSSGEKYMIEDKGFKCTDKCYDESVTK